MPNESLRVPTFCPLCSLVMKGTRSNFTYYDYGVCVLCKIEFVEGREDRWKNGWRPSQEELERHKKNIWGREDSNP